MSNHKYKFSVIMPIYNVEKYLTEAIQSVLKQTIGFENIQIILVNDESPDNSEAICLEYASKYPDNIVYVKKQNGGVSSARNYGIRYIEGKYVQFLDPDDSISPNTFEEVYTFFEENYPLIDLVAIPIYFMEGRKGQHNLNNKFKNPGVLDLREKPEYILTHCCSTFIKSDVMINYSFDENCRIGEDAKLVNLIISNKMQYGTVTNVKYNYRVREDGTSAMQTAQKNKNWYNHSLTTFSIDLLNQIKDKLNGIPDYIQYVIMHDLKWKLLVKDISDTPLNSNEYKEFINHITHILTFIEDEIILSTKGISHYYLFHALKLKYGNEYGKIVFEKVEDFTEVSNSPEDSNEDFEDEHLERSCNNANKQDDLILYVKDKSITRLSNERLTVEFIEEEGDFLRIEGFWGTLFEGEAQISAKIGEQFISYEKIRREVNDYISLGQVIKSYLGFSFKIPKISLVGQDAIQFFITKSNVTRQVGLRFNKFSGLTNNLKNSYVARKDYLFFYNKGELFIELNTFKNRFVHEIKFLKSLLRKRRSVPKKKKSAIIKAVAARSLFWGYQLFYRKPVWIFMDRQDKADDSAEQLFKYALAQDDGIHKVFVLKKDCPDYKRMKLVSKVVPFRSMRHKLLTLQASKVISTHADVWVVNPFFSTNEYYRDLFNFDFIFLQHGVTMADHSKWLNKYNKNIRLMITAAYKEYDSIVNGKYNYTEENVFLGGFPRYDNLINDKDKKQLLIMPTWRKDIVSPKDQAKGVRPYNPQFKESEYYKRYNALINDKTLINTARENGFKIVFFPHPDIQQQISDFERNDYVEFANYNSSYQEMFNTSSVMVTDFSSVAFDFAYQKKPVVYYQYESSYHFKLDYFDYKAMGFGDLIGDHEQLVEKLIYYMENNCEMEEKYKNRVDTFFAHTDQKNRERVYNAILNIERH